MAGRSDGPGKGDWRRPRRVSKRVYADNWERIFGSKVPTQRVTVYPPDGDVDLPMLCGCREKVSQSDNADAPLLVHTCDDFPHCAVGRSYGQDDG